MQPCIMAVGRVGEREKIWFTGAFIFGKHMDLIP
jgi:hypothetical protein